MVDKPARRPKRVTLLALLCLWNAIWNGIRLTEAFHFGKTLESYNASSLYIAISGGMWLLFSLALTFGLWRGRPWAWYVALGGVAGYTSWYWFDRLVLQEPRANWPFALGMTILLMAYITFTLFTRPTRIFFGNERRPQNSNPA